MHPCSRVCMNAVVYEIIWTCIHKIWHTCMLRASWYNIRACGHLILLIDQTCGDGPLRPRCNVQSRQARIYRDYYTSVQCSCIIHGRVVYNRNIYESDNFVWWWKVYMHKYMLSLCMQYRYGKNGMLMYTYTRSVRQRYAYAYVNCALWSVYTCVICVRTLHNHLYDRAMLSAAMLCVHWIYLCSRLCTAPKSLIDYCLFAWIAQHGSKQSLCVALTGQSNYSYRLCDADQNDYYCV